MIRNTWIVVLSSPLFPRCLFLPPIVHKNNGKEKRWRFFPGKDRAHQGIRKKTKGS
ncbi:hypothetical protein XELAEV_18024970mg [Xenopus laevis]|uniref:Uncharacterized protein n=1 Tax=Xenopus laevis TaxID=8355 RepID=A0A974D1H0_XENLA|nr:hypothetical protein XELAEV_18024970mg [Xenopus laevis]